MTDTETFQPRRSLIFAPGDKPAMFAKALRTGADVVCVDLEDAVAPEHKNFARRETLALFAEPQAAGGVERMVRVNSPRTPEGFADFLAIVESTAPPPALMLTKVKTADEIVLLDELLASHPAIRFHVIIETNEGLKACHEIARASRRIASLLFGAIDMAAELRVEPVWDALLYARSRLVHAAAGAGLDLIDVPWLDLGDMAGLETAAAAARGLGFTGKAAIHPKQIAVLNQCFTPGTDEIARARRVIAAFDAAEGGLVMVDGKLIEKPVLRSAQRITAIADRLAAVGNDRAGTP